MLKSHEADESSNNSLAGQARVTPEELSQALASIEAHKQAEVSRLAGTISVSQAVSELNLDATPEEIMAEVKAQRTRADQAKKAQEPPSSAGLTARNGRAGSRQMKSGRWPNQSRGKDALGVGIAVVTLIVGLAVGPFHRHTPLVSHETRALSATPDNAPLFGDLATVQQIAGGTPPAQVRVHLGDDLRNSWRLIRHGDRVYVQAYTLPVTEQAIKAGRPFRLYNNNDAGQLERKHYTDITLPLRGLHWDDSRSTDEGWGEITVSNVHPDAHVWENW